MKRLYVHVAVEDLTHSIGFYSALFAAGRGGLMLLRRAR